MKRGGKRKLPCTIQSICRICPHVNSDYLSTLDKKAKRDLKKLKESGLLGEARILRTISSPRKLGYRTVFKLAVRKNPDKNSPNRFRLGLFETGTHQIGPDMTGCPLHSAPLRNFLKALGPLLESSSLNPYDEKAHSGDLRYLIGRTNQNGNALMVTWVTTRSIANELKELTEAIKKQGFALKVSAMNVNSKQDNVIWGDETVLLSQDSVIEEEMMGFQLSLGPTSFFQVNPWQAENIYRRISHLAEKQVKKEVAWDLFSGVGPISLVLSQTFQKVLSIEENEESAKLAMKNKLTNRCDEKVTVTRSRAEESGSEIPPWAAHPDLIVVNPSRRGIHVEARKLIKNALSPHAHAKLIYLSCNIDSFVRDAMDFYSNGYKLTEIQGFDMHAQSDQVEWLGLFEQI